MTATATVADRVRLRAATEGDRPFLETLFASTRARELEGADWPAAVRDWFVTTQVDLQEAQYRRAYAGADFSLVLIAGEPAGRLYVHRGPTEIRVIDISLLPGHRGGGIGTFLLKRLLDEAAASRRDVSLCVRSDNPARALYARLGLREVERTSTDILMRRVAS